MIQINDLILGAIGFHKNGNHLLAHSNTAKVALSNYIADKAGVKDLGNDTPMLRKRFEIWNIKLKK